MASLFFRNLFFTLLQPGLVAAFFPYLIVKGAVSKTGGAVQIAGIVLGLTGLVVMLACIFRFATEGQGTLSPADPTKNLVAGGFYRYSRNPMYLGVMGILVGESIFFGIVPLWLYSLLVFAVFNLFIVFVEEPRLKRDFGEAWADYCRRVGRWF